MRIDGRRAMHRRASGFSLLEVMLVMLLIAAMSVLAAAAVTGGFAGMRVRAEAKQIAAQLRYTRAQAISTGQSQKFLIDPAAHTWLAPNNRKGDVAKAFGVSFYGAREVQPMRGVGAIQFFPERRNRLRAQCGRRRRHIDQITGVRDDGVNSRFLDAPAKAGHFIGGNLPRPPLAGGLGEDLQRLAA